MSPCQVPVELVLLLTVPVVDPDKDDLNWKRPLNCLHILTSPLICVLTLKSGACKSLGQSQLAEGDRIERPPKPWGLQEPIRAGSPLWGGEMGRGEPGCVCSWIHPHKAGGLGVLGGNGAGLACLGKLRHRGEQLCGGTGQR